MRLLKGPPNDVLSELDDGYSEVGETDSIVNYVNPNEKAISMDDLSMKDDTANNSMLEEVRDELELDLRIFIIIFYIFRRLAQRAASIFGY
jgi:hypothetical protein